MPNPLVGSGAPVSKGLERYKYAFYLAPASGGATYPANKLGAASEPTGGWVRQGRLREDSITYNVGDLDWLDGRAGFDRSRQWRVPRQAEDVRITVRLDESDPDVQAKLRGSASATYLSSGSNTGYEQIYKAGQYYNAKVLLVGLEVQGAAERHIYGGKCVVQFKPVTEDEYQGLDVSIDFLDVSSTETFRDRRWD
jgi:hypothetical protein